MNTDTLCIRAGGFSALLASIACAAWAATEPPDAPPAAEKKAQKPESPPVHTVQRGALKKETKLEAVVTATDMRPLSVDTKAWAECVVVEVVPHGSRVKKGEVVLRLDTDKIEEQIDDMEAGQPATNIALELAVAELENLKQTTPLKLESAQRSRRRAEDDLDYFEKTDRAQKEKGTRFGLKSAEQRLENEREELEQLQKMYEADDLTEETEEIILKRQKFAVEAAEHQLEASRLGTERSLNTLIPREHETLTTQKQEQALALALAEETLPRALTQKRQAVEKLERDRKKAEKKLAELKSDLRSLTVTSPIDGIVYYGACENGKWPTAAAMDKKLVPGGKLQPREIVMTVVKPDPVVLKAVVPENRLGQVRSGLRGQASLVSAPERKLAVRVTEVGQVPLPGGGFLATLSARKAKGVTLMPGMTCEVILAGGKKPGALLAPKEAVFTEGDQKFVYVAKEEIRHEKRAVKAGESDDRMIEVLEGLAEGDKILIQKPE